MTNPSWIGGLFASFVRQSSLEEWAPLNPPLTETLFCTYKASYVLQSLIGKLQKETLRGGVAIKRMDGDADGIGSPKPPFVSKKKKAKARTTEPYSTLSPAAHARLVSALNRAILYGILYGLVPVMVDTDHPESLRVPPITAGCFVARMHPNGKVDVGWQWHQDGMYTDSSGPDPKVWVFVWEDREPIVGSSAPFRSVIQSLLPELFRERELVEDDTQAHHELSKPSMVLQENPRTQNKGEDAVQVIEYIVDDMLEDPYGYGAGRGPGGTMSRQQRRLGRQDLGAALRARESESRGLRAYRGDTGRIQLDPCTGEAVLVERTVSWQRGSYVAPAGLIPTTAYARPNLRGDLIAQREHVIQSVAAALGIPASIVFTGHISSSRMRRAHSSVANYRSYDRGGSGGGADSDALSAMRDTIASVREELSAMFGQAHYHLLWFNEALSLSKDVVLAEQMIEEDTESTQAMARQLELMGSSLRRAWQANRRRRLRDTVAFHKAVAIADQASKLWKEDMIHQRITALLRIVSGDWNGSVGGTGDMSVEDVHARERRGERLTPAPPGVLRDVDDDGDVTDPPHRIRSVDDDDYEEDDQNKRRGPEDPNALAEYPREREERIRAEGHHVAGYTQDVVGEGMHTRYESRALTEDPPQFKKALERARQLVEARLERMANASRMRSRLRPVSGERGETKVELVWKVPPLPDWPLLRELAQDGIMNARLFQSMYLTHLGFDPEVIPEVLVDTDPFGPKSPHLRAILLTKAKSSAPKATAPAKKAEEKKSKKRKREKDKAAAAAEKRQQEEEKEKEGGKEGRASRGVETQEKSQGKGAPSKKRQRTEG